MAGSQELDVDAILIENSNLRRANAQLTFQLDRQVNINHAERADSNETINQLQTFAGVSGGINRKLAPVWGQLTRWYNEMRQRRAEGYDWTRAEESLYTTYEEARDALQEDADDFPGA